MEQLLTFLQPLVELYGGSQGWLVQAISIIGSLRLFIKPIMSLLSAYVTFTKDEKDNLKFDEVEKGNTLKTVIYVLDWFASIKVKKK
jgi:hypothetical protein